MAHQPKLAELAKAAGSTRRKPELVSEEAIPQESPSPAKQKSRQSSVPITVQQPEAVRTQLKLIALEQGDTLENIVAQAFNDCFAKYSKPEIAFVKPRRSREA